MSNKYLESVVNNEIFFQVFTHLVILISQINSYQAVCKCNKEEPQLFVIDIKQKLFNLMSVLEVIKSLSMDIATDEQTKIYKYSVYFDAGISMDIIEQPDNIQVEEVVRAVYLHRSNFQYCLSSLEDSTQTIFNEDAKALMTRLLCDLEGMRDTLIRSMNKKDNGLIFRKLSIDDKKSAEIMGVNLGEYTEFEADKSCSKNKNKKKKQKVKKPLLFEMRTI